MNSALTSCINCKSWVLQTEMKICIQLFENKFLIFEFFLLFRIWVWNSNHVLAATTVVLCLNHYLPIVTSMNKSICFRILLMIFKVSVWLCLGLQVFTTIATRNHYTVDIWLAILFSYMNWTWHYNVILKRDPVIGKMKSFSNVKIY